MSRNTHRYRITVMPIQGDGLPCTGRCTLEFEQRGQRDWMQHFECAQRQRRLSCNDDASVVVAAGLLASLSSTAAKADSPLRCLQPELDLLLAKLDRLQTTP